ncbi:hypothetical protein AB0J35_45435 [Nonomuraea angiospora]|uniref:hypothetical protein n=1 Tax=Nonomuraea angiospora TaxID=46172 RepID=UPI003435BC39
MIMESFLRAPRPSAGARPVRPVEFHTWRALLDLGGLEEPASAGVIPAALAHRNLDLPEHAQLPVQSRPGPAFRDRLTESPPLAGYALTDPAELPDHLRTEAWNRMCRLSASFDDLDVPDRVRLTGLLAGVGLYRHLATLSTGSAEEVAADPRLLLVRARIAHARSVTDRTDATLHASIEALQNVLACGLLSAATRLGAATTLLVLHAQYRMRDLESVGRYRNAAHELTRRLDPDNEWLDVLHLSTYWRAASFQPFLAGDRRRTREELDLAESLARRIPADTQEQRWIRDLNLHPLLETRAKAALWAGDADRAVAFATELRDHDPLDGKVHVQLGDVHVRRDEPRAALACYLMAAALGAPYRSLAWCKAAEVMEPAGSAHALMCAHRGDPQAVTPLLRQERLARRRGDDRLAEWAGRTAHRLRMERSEEGEGELCVRNS